MPDYPKTKNMCANPVCQEEATVLVRRMDGTLEATCNKCIPKVAMEVKPL
jgi:hypothetical protein